MATVTIEKSDLETLKEFTKNTHWLLENVDRLRGRYPDRYVAVFDSGKLVLDSPTMKELIDSIIHHRRNPESAAIEFVTREPYLLIVWVLEAGVTSYGGMTATIRIELLAIKGQHCFVTALFVCDHAGIKAPLKFIVDTGSVHTTLPETKARELGVDMEKLETYKVKLKMGGLGGGADARMLAGVRVIFTSTDNSTIEEKLPFVHVLRDPPARDEAERKIIETFPPLLGLDIIRRYTLKFGEKNFAYLER